jgi:hypothetical protein
MPLPKTVLLPLMVSLPMAVLPPRRCCCRDVLR